MNLRLTRVAVACGFAVALVAATASCSFVPRAHEAQDRRQAAGAPCAASHRAAELRPERLLRRLRGAGLPPLTPKTLPGPAALPVAATATTCPATGRCRRGGHRAIAAGPTSRGIVARASHRVPNPSDTHILLTFPFGSATLTAESRQTLRRSLRLARESDRIVISGRTDSVGPDEVNQQLALARALAVRNFIRDAVPDLPNVIAIDAKGRCCFVASNDDESGRSRNRRVEVVFTSMGVM
jgi:flagellar motor protein MotB